MRAFARAHKWTPPWYEQERAELLERLFWSTRSDAAEGPTSVAIEVSSSLICSHWSPDTVTAAKS